MSEGLSARQSKAGAVRPQARTDEANGVKNMVWCGACEVTNMCVPRTDHVLQQDGEGSKDTGQNKDKAVSPTKANGKSLGTIILIATTTRRG